MSTLAQLVGAPSTQTVVLLLKATVLLLAAIVGTLALRRSSAGMRHLIWVVTLASLIVLPSLISSLPLRLAVLPASFGAAASPATRETLAQAPASEPASAEAPAVRGEPAAPQVAAPTFPSPTPAAPFSPLTVLLAVWAVGVVGCLGWLLHGVWSVARIVKRAEPMTAPEWVASLYEVADRVGLEHAPRLLASSNVAMPFASGLFHPVIVLPHDAHTWTADRRTSVLLHELAHIKRRDLIGHTLGRLACSLYWFHPLVWTGARRLRIESERACDDIAIRCGARPSDYAEHLLDIVTTVRRQFTPAVAIAMAHRKEFEGRMLAILDPDVRRAAPSRRQTALSVGMLAVLALCVGAAAPAEPARVASVQHAQVADTSDLHAVATPITPRGGSSSKLHVEARRESRTDTVTTMTFDATTSKTRSPNAALEQLISDAARTGTTVASAAVRELLSGNQQQKRSDDRAKLLLNILKTDTSAAVRRIAAWGLQDYADQSAVAEALADALRRDNNAEVREMAAWALGESDRSKSAADALINAARSDADDKVRATAIWALGEAEEKSAMDVFLAALNAKDESVRELAMWAIGNVEPDKLPAPVLAGLSDASPRVRRLSAWVAYKVGDPAAIPALESALGKEHDSDLRRSYVRAMASAGENSADALAKLLGSTDPEIRSMAVRALAGGGATGPWPWPWPRPRPNP